jgi:hypothetical protein
LGGDLKAIAIVNARIAKSRFIRLLTAQPMTRRQCRSRMNTLILFDCAGVAVFAATGALAASRIQFDLIGFLFLAAITGIGGGTFSDLVLGAGPVFWIANPTYLLVSSAVAAAVYFGLAREKEIKKWRREWKIALIEKFDPQWFGLLRGWGW